MAVVIDLDRKRNEATSSVQEEKVLKEIKAEREKQEESRPKFTRKPVRVACTKEELEEIRKRASYSYVNDFGEGCDYFLSDEERKKQNENYSYLKRIRGNKKRYNRINQYIIACRNVYQYLTHLADTNLIYTPEKWMKLFWKGQIEVYGLSFPKLASKKMKTLNKDWLLKAITDPEYDISKIEEDLRPTELDEEDLTITTPNNLLERVIDQSIKNRNNWKSPLLYSEEEYQMGMDDVIVPASKKDMKQMKKIPEMLEAFNKIRTINDIRSMNESGGNIVARCREELQMEEERMNNSLLNQDPYPEFSGSVLNKEDVRIYSALCDAWVERNTYITDPNDGKRKTIAQAKRDEIYFLLERDFDMRKFNNNYSSSQMINAKDEAEQRLRQAESMSNIERISIERKKEENRLTAKELAAYKLRKAESEFSIAYYKYIIENNGKGPSNKWKKQTLKKCGLRALPNLVREYQSKVFKNLFK